jgi:hypothetical protein
MTNFPKKTIKLSIVVSLATVAAAADAATEPQLSRYQCKPVEGKITRSSICIDRGVQGEQVSQLTQNKDERE